MFAPGTSVKRAIILERLLERRSVAFVHGLADACRAWPELRHWLCEEFGTRPHVRENFRALIAKPPATHPLDGPDFMDLADEADAWHREVAHLKATLGVTTPQLFGGRTWMEMEQLVRRYEAGNLDLGVFMLVRHWHKLGDRARFAPDLQRAAAELLDAVIRHGETRLWSNLTRARTLLGRLNRANLRSTFGHSDWWKLHALLYIMSHPRPAYCTRDVRAHLAKLGLHISSLDFRRFCKRHGIRRDMRAGRPRTHT